MLQKNYIRFGYLFLYHVGKYIYVIGDFLPSTKTAKLCVTMHVILVFCFVILGVKI